MMVVGSHLSWLESQCIHIIREAVAEARKPVMLFSAGKDSTVMALLRRVAPSSRAKRCLHRCRRPEPDAVPTRG
jgi:3'-phosphoadenosine 5'-phosphosulfate sulfotransferase (PAPS reductase)/FAD synthetase